MNRRWEEPKQSLVSLLGCLPSPHQISYTCKRTVSASYCFPTAACGKRKKNVLALFLLGVISKAGSILTSVIVVLWCLFLLVPEPQPLEGGGPTSGGATSLLRSEFSPLCHPSLVSHRSATEHYPCAGKAFFSLEDEVLEMGLLMNPLF